MTAKILALLLLLATCGKHDSIDAIPTPEERPAPGMTIVSAETAEDTIEEAPVETEITEEIPAEETVEEETEDGLVLVALGDSIAHGYGLADLTTEAYITVAGEALGADAAYNFGVDGMDSTGLVKYIAENPEIPAALADADYVTISIGANNFLGDAFSFLLLYNEYAVNPNTSSTPETIEAAFQAFNAARTEGLEQLRADIPVIIDSIREVNADCEILFQTCYNPYAAVNVTLDWTTASGTTQLPFPIFSDASVTYMNDIILELASENGYTVADVYSAFAGQEGTLVNAAPVEAGTSFNALQMDPHPNAAGHQVIAEVVGELMAD